MDRSCEGKSCLVVENQLTLMIYEKSLRMFGRVLNRTLQFHRKVKWIERQRREKDEREVERRVERRKRLDLPAMKMSVKNSGQVRSAKSASAVNCFEVRKVEGAHDS